MTVHILPEVRGSRFTVQRFKVLCCLALFIFPQIVDESTDCSTGTCGLPVNVVKLLLRYVVFIQSNIEFALHLGTRPLGVSQKKAWSYPRPFSTSEP